VPKAERGAAPADPPEQHDTDPGGPPPFDEPTGADVDVTEPDAIAPTFDAEDEVAPQAASVTVAVHRQIKLAPIWRRVLASVVDLVLIALLSAVHLLVALARLPDTVGPARGTGFDRVIDATLVYADATLPTGVVFLALLVLYQTVFIALLGQTPGQVLLKLHVVSGSQRRVGLGASFVRGLFAALGLLLVGIGWSAIFLSRRRRTLHDLISGTYVGDATDEVLTSLPEPAAQEPG
jgi:uncharacterized RDD family membrane protein YckC